MKKVITIIIIIVAFVIEIYFSYNYKRLDPNVESVEYMVVMKMKAMLVMDKVYTEKDKEKISIILNALKNRTRENNRIRFNTYNYFIDMMVKDKKKGGFIQHRYAIWVDKDGKGTYITIASISDKSYKLHADSAILIEKYLAGIN